MPPDARFVTFLARRYSALSGLGAVAFAAAVIAAAPLLTGDWDLRAFTVLAAIAAALIAVCIRIQRYYARQFGRVKAADHQTRQPWYVGIGIVALENVGRQLPRHGFAGGAVALGLAGVTAMDAWRDGVHRKHAFLYPLVLAYIGIDRMTASYDVDFWIWLQRSVVVVAIAFLATGVLDHLLIVNGLSAHHRRLALSSAALPSGRDLPTVARDPLVATVLTALGACDEADVVFLANLAGLHAEDTLALVERLGTAGLVWIEGKDGPRPPMIRLSANGHHAVRHLWDDAGSW